MNMKIEFVETSPLWKRVLPYRKLAKTAIDVALAESGVQLKRGVEMAVHLIDDDKIRVLNAQWRKKNSPTDVLSFPAVNSEKVSDTRLLGDVLIAYETMERDAKAEGRPLGEHFTHLVVHGFLHLLGHDHMAELEAEAMEKLETQILAKLGISDPYAIRDFADAAA